MKDQKVLPCNLFSNSLYPIWIVQSGTKSTVITWQLSCKYRKLIICLLLEGCLAWKFFRHFETTFMFFIKGNGGNIYVKCCIKLYLYIFRLYFYYRLFLWFHISVLCGYYPCFVCFIDLLSTDNWNETTFRSLYLTTKF